MKRKSHQLIKDDHYVAFFQSTHPTDDQVQIDLNSETIESMALQHIANHIDAQRGSEANAIGCPRIDNLHKFYHIFSINADQRNKGEFTALVGIGPTSPCHIISITKENIEQWANSCLAEQQPSFQPK